MRFLLQLTPPVSFFIVSAITTFLGLAGLYLVRRKYSAEVLKENHEVAAIIFNAFGLFYGVLIAFVVFVTWNGYDEATKNLQMEASEALDIFHNAEAFPDASRKIIQQGLRDYVAAVYNDEVPKMAEGDISLYTGGAHATLRVLFAQVDATVFKQPGPVSANENICRERYRATRYLVGVACRRPLRGLLHLFLRHEKHSGPIPHYHDTDRNGYVNPILDLCT